MSDLPLSRLAELERRFDGPIPARLLDTEAAQRRRVRGVIALLESQAAEFLAEAERLVSRLEEETDARKMDDLRERIDNHQHYAAEAFSNAAKFREDLGLGKHPVVAVASLIAKAAP